MLWACWTRARTIGGKSAWDPESEKQFRHFTLEAIRLTRFDGSLMLARRFNGAAEPELFAGRARAGETQIARPGRGPHAAGLQQAGDARPLKPAPAVNSEWSEIAVLQPSWRRGGPKLTLVYAERQVQLELECRRELVFSGNWDLESPPGRRPLEITSDWEEVCWMSDKDVDYVEIQARFSSGVIVQRQALLARQDRCLLLADAVVGDRPGRLNTAAVCRSAPAIAVEPAAETREVWLAGRRNRLAVYRWHCRNGESTRAAANLPASATPFACGNRPPPTGSMPPVVDLDAERAGRGVTWRS